MSRSAPGAALGRAPFPRGGAGGGPASRRCAPPPHPPTSSLVLCRVTRNPVGGTRVRRAVLKLAPAGSVVHACMLPKHVSMSAFYHTVKYCYCTEVQYYTVQCTTHV